MTKVSLLPPHWPVYSPQRRRSQRTAWSFRSSACRWRPQPRWPRRRSRPVEKGIQIGVTVVDRDGIAQAVLRDTIAPTITVPISQGKAYAAVMFNVATSELADRANTDRTCPGCHHVGPVGCRSRSAAHCSAVSVSQVPPVVTPTRSAHRRCRCGADRPGDGRIGYTGSTSANKNPVRMTGFFSAAADAIRSCGRGLSASAVPISCSGRSSRPSARRNRMKNSNSTSRVVCTKTTSPSSTMISP